MRVLLDTHLLIWALRDDAALPRSGRSAILSSTAVFVSMASFWEIAIKASIGKLKLDLDGLPGAVRRAGFDVLPIDLPHVQRVRSLPHYHRDPFDRMLVAQAGAEELLLLTSDGTLQAYGGDVVRVVR
ncbi:type II toxin-antitoxin system VapC family toxin [Salinarimonas sp.]|uniref:type II toxin-antitoxin system VapC family toxin n=1 Tax=Salinarimonas sp. TaxID=2766526 RepID=UPI0032D99B72